MDILYMDGSGIYQNRMIYIFGNCPTNRSDAIGRKVDAGRKKRSKMPYFSRFLDYFTYFPIWYQLEILNEGRKQRVTSYPGVLEYLVYTKCVNCTKKCQN